MKQLRQQRLLYKLRSQLQKLRHRNQLQRKQPRKQVKALVVETLQIAALHPAAQALRQPQPSRLQLRIIVHRQEAITHRIKSHHQIRLIMISIMQKKQKRQTGHAHGAELILATVRQQKHSGMIIWSMFMVFSCNLQLNHLQSYEGASAPSFCCKRIKGIIPLRRGSLF